MKVAFLHTVFCILITLTLLACHQKKAGVSEKLIDLKRGEVISCSPGEKQFGEVEFEISCKGKAKEDFNTAIKLLHSFEYDEAEKVFAKVIDTEPECAMAYWGVAMSNFHPLWSPSTPAEAGTILNALYARKPNHPGIVHYIIHTYDSPELAELALPAARKYASVAPSLAHALHMPSHIFTRLGLWDECIRSNLTSVSSAKCYAEASGIKGHWDEELHGLDYLVYAYLQKGDNEHAKEQFEYLNTINEVHPVNFKVAYAFAAIPSRYFLENKLWKEAANLQVHKTNIDWQNFQWEKAIIHFTRLFGSVNTGNLPAARTELNELKHIHEKLQDKKETYKANKVQIQLKASEAWILFKEGRNDEAVMLMNVTADLEDKTGKHPVTPGDVIPARELLGDLLLQMNKPGEALKAYEGSLHTTPNRLNSLYGAGLSAEKSGNNSKANLYYGRLLANTNAGNSSRTELTSIKKYLTTK